MVAEAITFDLFLLIITLVLIGIVLFISLVSVIYTVRLAYKMDTLLKVLDSFRPVPKMEYPAPSGEPTPQKSRFDTSAGESVSIPIKERFDPVRDAPDIMSGMRRLCEIHGIEALTLSNPDGLVVASSGDPSADEDAARMSYAAASGTPISERGMSVFPLEYKGSNLVGIIKSQSQISEAALAALRKDIESLLERWI